MDATYELAVTELARQWLYDYLDRFTKHYNLTRREVVLAMIAANETRDEGWALDALEDLMFELVCDTMPHVDMVLCEWVEAAFAAVCVDLDLEPHLIFGGRPFER